MDQMTCVHSSAHQLFSLLCQHALHPPYHHVSLPSHIQLLGIDSGVKRSTASVAYQRIRTAAFMGKQLLKPSTDLQHLGQLSLSTFNRLYRKSLPETIMGRDFIASAHLDSLSRVDSGTVYPIRTATAHPIEENFRVQLFERLLRDIDPSTPVGDFHTLGELMFQSDAAYTACDLHSEETQLLVKLIRQHRSSADLVFGAKITGGGGGGTVAVLAQNSLAATETIHEIIDRYETMTRQRTCLFSGSSSGLTVYPSVVMHT